MRRRTGRDPIKDLDMALENLAWWEKYYSRKRLGYYADGLTEAALTVAHRLKAAMKAARLSTPGPRRR